MILRGTWLCVELTLRSMILRRTWLHAVSYCRELSPQNLLYCTEPDSEQYDTGRNLTLRSQSRKTRITRQNLYKNLKYFNPFLSGQGRLELCYKKQVEQLVWLPFKKDREKSHDSLQYHTARNSGKYQYLGKNDTKNLNYFNQLVSGPGRLKWWKKLGVENLVGLSL